MRGGNEKQNWEDAIASIIVDSRVETPSSQALSNSATAKIQEISKYLTRLAEGIENNRAIRINEILYQKSKRWDV